MDSILHLNEFFVEGGDPKKSHVLLNITEPATPEEQAKGYFFAICEVNNSETKHIAKIQETIDDIQNQYYEVPDQENKTALEVVLDAVNKKTFAPASPGVALNCIVGAIRDEEVLFSIHGKPMMLLFYGAKDDSYKLMDLVGDNTGEQTEEERRQMFSQIVQGKISPGDYFFAGTPYVAEYFNPDRLQKIITTRPPRQSAEHLQRVLAELKNSLSFGGIIIHLQKDGEAAEKSSPAKKGESARSLTNLFNTEQQTAHILSPSLLPRLQNKLNTAMKKEQDTADATEKASPYADTKINSAHFKAHQAPRRVRGETARVCTSQARCRIFSPKSSRR